VSPLPIPSCGEDSIPSALRTLLREDGDASLVTASGRAIRLSSRLAFPTQPPTRWGRHFHHEVTLESVAADGARWTKTLGVFDSYEAAERSIAVDAAGAITVTGGYLGVLELDGLRLPSRSTELSYNHDIFLVRLGADGSALWGKVFAGPFPLRVAGVVADSHGAVYLAGSGDGRHDLDEGPLRSRDQGRGFVVKLGENGSEVWRRSFGGAGWSHVVDIAIAQDDAVIVAGSFGGTIDFGTGPRRCPDGANNTFVVQLTPSGQTKRVATFRGDGYQNPSALAVGADGDLLVAGTLKGTVDFGGVFLASDKDLAGNWQHSGFLLQLSAELTHRRSKRLSSEHGPLVAGLGAGGFLFASRGRWRRLDQGALIRDLAVTLRYGRGAPSSLACVLSCAQRPACRISGRCTPEGDGCVAATDADCRSSDACGEQGRCHAEAGACTVAEDEDCARSKACTDEGACIADRESNACVATAASCRASRACSVFGRCGENEGKCIVTRALDCRKAVVCSEEGRCTAGKNAFTDDGRVCNATSPRDCRRSSRCRRHGECTLMRNDTFAMCRVKDDADCARSEGCLEHGRCTLQHAKAGQRCSLTSDADCKKSRLCTEHGRCRFAGRACVK
jgi:hypothetical protein